jgi:hypothetical protein
MSYTKNKVNYWKDNFRKYSHFDIVPYAKVIEELITKHSDGMNDLLIRK